MTRSIATMTRIWLNFRRDFGSAARRLIFSMRPNGSFFGFISSHCLNVGTNPIGGAQLVRHVQDLRERGFFLRNGGAEGFHRDVGANSFQGFGWVFTILAFVVVGLIIYYYPQVDDRDWWLRLAMGLQMGGALGNVIDRLTNNGQVTDFISVGKFAVFNLADASISVGVVILLAGTLFKDLSDRKLAADKLASVDLLPAEVNSGVEETTPTPEETTLIPEETTPTPGESVGE